MKSYIVFASGIPNQPVKADQVRFFNVGAVSWLQFLNGSEIVAQFNPNTLIGYVEGTSAPPDKPSQ